MTSRAHMQEGASQQLTEKHQGARRGQTGWKRAWDSRPRPADLACYEPGSCPPLTYVLLYILPLPLPAATWIHSSESRRHEGEAPGGSRRSSQVLELLRRCLRPCPIHHGWPCVVKPWWSSGAATWILQVVCTFNIQWWCNHILSYFDLHRWVLYSYV
jgi:hypothetical protein